MTHPFIRRTLSAAAGLSLALGVAAAAAPAATAGGILVCGWQSLTLVNGWHSENSVYGTGDPRYCIEDGIV